MAVLLRPTWAEINLQAVKYNLKNIKNRLAENVGILAIIKAEAYGHGAREVAKICTSDVKILGVALIEEGIFLRRQEIKKPILILGSIFPFKNFNKVLEYNLIPTVCSWEGVKSLAAIAKKKKKKIKIHLKVDTGMGRIGISPVNTIGLVKKILSLGNLIIDGIYTHFPVADTDSDFTPLEIRPPDVPSERLQPPRGGLFLTGFTLKQINIFKEIIKNLEKEGIAIPYKHTANSAAILKYKESHFNLVRPGLLIYGISPFAGAENEIDLQPALTLKTKIVYLKKVPAGTSISYGREFITTKPSTIATLPIGYADGYPWRLGNKGTVLIRGRRVPILGRVCMDMCMVDVTDIDGVEVGEEVILIGTQGQEKISIEEIANLTGTIPYEIACGISKRVPRIYI